MSRSREFSGKFVLRTGPDLHARLSEEARARGISLNEHCVRKLAGAHAADRFAGIGLDAAFIEQVVEAFPVRPVGIALFGSFARGEQGPGSDIDMLVVLDRGARLTRSMYRGFDDRVDVSGFAHPPNPHLVALPERPEDSGGIWLEAALDGIVLWEEGRLVSRFLRLLRERIATGEVRRRTSGGQPYWVRWSDAG
jgi:predicted nucleotidyltransferase